MSDQELIKWAKQMGIEKSLVFDCEGGLVNSDEIEQELNNIMKEEF